MLDHYSVEIWHYMCLNIAKKAKGAMEGKFHTPSVLKLASVEVSHQIQKPGTNPIRPWWRK